MIAIIFLIEEEGNNLVEVITLADVEYTNLPVDHSSECPTQG